MRQETKVKAISSSALEYLKHLIGKDTEIVNVVVHGKWLKASLGSGVRFSNKE